MRLAVLSDIHGNLTALETALADLDAQGGADVTWVLGDLAAFGPRPAECVQRIRTLETATNTEENKHKFGVIGGNTDRYMVTGERMKLPSAKDADQLTAMVHNVHERDLALNWGVARLTWDDYEYLSKIRGRELALPVEGYGWVIGFHAIPGNDETIITAETSAEEANDALLDREGRLALCGHTHVQMDRDLGAWRLINVGSVGMSFEDGAKAHYAILTFADGDVQVDLRAVPYDVAALTADFEAVGHPTPQWMLSRMKLIVDNA